MLLILLSVRCAGYQILDEIGRGGSSTVYRSVQIYLWQLLGEALVGPRQAWTVFPACSHHFYIYVPLRHAFPIQSIISTCYPLASLSLGGEKTGREGIQQGGKVVKLVVRGPACIGLLSPHAVTIYL